MYNVRMSSQRTNNDMNSLPPVVGLLVGLVSNDRKDKKKYAYLLVGWIYIKEAEKNVQGASFTLRHGNNQSIVQTAVHVVEIKYIGPSKVRNTITITESILNIGITETVLFLHVVRVRVDHSIL
jgi:hypothetical protein